MKQKKTQKKENTQNSIQIFMQRVEYTHLSNSLSIKMRKTKI